jgi:hypothetical protein
MMVIVKTFWLTMSRACVVHLSGFTIEKMLSEDGPNAETAKLLVRYSKHSNAFRAADQPRPRGAYYSVPEVLIPMDAVALHKK